jgi:antitoxin component HigA of HigAB toxin-antitoxin module
VVELERQERLQVMLTADELEALENWRFEQRMPSRAAAVRELLRRGLAAEGKLALVPGTKSGDFGVLEPSPGNGEDAAG